MPTSTAPTVSYTGHAGPVAAELRKSVATMDEDHLHQSELMELLQLEALAGFLDLFPSSDFAGFCPVEKVAEAALSQCGRSKTTNQKLSIAVADVFAMLEEWENDNTTEQLRPQAEKMLLLNLLKLKVERTLGAVVSGRNKVGRSTTGDELQVSSTASTSSRTKPAGRAPVGISCRENKISKPALQTTSSTD
ncbi:unnamed protein product, partial [Amoebophrya sp. A120]|eukprot:GSA120T00018120001.1